jgi:hypothetical protein
VDLKCPSSWASGHLRSSSQHFKQREMTFMDLKQCEQEKFAIADIVCSAQAIDARNDGSLAPPHAIVDVEDVRFDLIADAILRELRHLQHVQDGTGVSTAPLDKRGQD